MSNSIKMSVGVPGRNSKNNIRQLLTLERLIEWIKSHRLDKQTEDGLIELAANYPTAAFPSFQRNFAIMINRVRQKRKFENRQITDPEAPLDKLPIKPAKIEIGMQEFVKKGKEYVKEEQHTSLRERTRSNFIKKEENISNELKERFEQNIAEVSQEDFDEQEQQEASLSVEELEIAINSIEKDQE